MLICMPCDKKTHPYIEQCFSAENIENTDYITPLYIFKIGLFDGTIQASSNHGGYSYQAVTKMSSSANTLNQGCFIPSLFFLTCNVSLLSFRSFSSHSLLIFSSNHFLLPSHHFPYFFSHFFNLFALSTYFLLSSFPSCLYFVVTSIFSSFI